MKPDKTITALLAGILVACSVGAIGIWFSRGVSPPVLGGGSQSSAGGALSASVTAQFRADPMIRKHLGGISSCEWNFPASADETSRVPGSQIQVFDVEGPNGKGQIYGPQLPTATESRFLAKGTLRLPDGQTFDLGN